MTCVGEHRLEVKRSGYVSWGFEGVGAADEPWALLVWPALFLVSLLTHLLIFRAGWTIHVHAANGGYRKIRYRSKKKARADLENQRALAGTIPAPPPPKPSRRPKFFREPE
jgi:hypothetical protein